MTRERLYDHNGKPQGNLTRLGWWASLWTLLRGRALYRFDPSLGRVTTETIRSRQDAWLDNLAETNALIQRLKNDT